MTTATATMSVLTADELLKNWQGHRALTRRTIEAFPEDELFNFSLGGMRPFAAMAAEFIGMAVPIVDGVATGKWVEYGGRSQARDQELRFWRSGIGRQRSSMRSSPPFRRTALPKSTPPSASGRCRGSR